MTTNNNNTSVRELIAARNHASRELLAAECKIDLAITEHLKAALDLLDGNQLTVAATELRATLAASLPWILSCMVQDACADQ